MLTHSPKRFEKNVVSDELLSLPSLPRLASPILQLQRDSCAGKACGDEHCRSLVATGLSQSHEAGVGASGPQGQVDLHVSLHWSF